jgi:hypothetical protein
MSKKEKIFLKNIRIGVFCEGKTEKAYIDKIKTTTKFSQSKYKLIPIDCNSRNKIENEIAKSRKAKYDKKIAIFDREDINKPTDKKIFDGLIKFCTTNKINYLYSIPSFEVWLLLHTQEKIDLTKITNGNKAKEQVKEKFKILNNSQAEYEKVFLNLETATAIKNSKENKIPARLKKQISIHTEVEFITNFHELFDIIPNS